MSGCLRTGERSQQMLSWHPLNIQGAEEVSRGTWEVWTSIQGGWMSRA